MEGALLARNMGQRFVDVSSASGPAFLERWASRGVASGDIDNDGRIDLVISTNNGAAHILRNETKNVGHWLLVRLVGHTSNRDGIGAVIKITTAHGDQYQTVTTASSYCSSNDKRAHFGLGVDTAARMVEIRWPGGIVQRLDHVAGDRVLTVEEPSATR